MKKKIDSLQKIIWLIDPFQEDTALLMKTFSQLKSLTSGIASQIEPVYVLVPDEIDRMAFTMDLLSIKDYRDASKKAVKKFISKIKYPGLKAPQVLENPKGTRMGAIHELLKYAKKNKANLIVTSSHGKKGLNRFFMGSFAENIILHSQTPVFILNPNTANKKNYKKILFPTHFSSKDKKTYKNLLEFAKAHGSEITLFHQVPNYLDPVISSGAIMLGGGTVTFDQYLSDETERTRKTAKRWAKEAEKLGVSVRILISPRGRSIVDAILKTASSKKMSLIAMSSETGAIASRVLGSISRQVARHAPVPVWIQHQ